MKPIESVAQKLGIQKSELELHGNYVAKIAPSGIARFRNQKSGILVLVTAMTPTPHGEGKTTTAIGLCDALNRLGTRAIVTLRQPSLGVVFGLKGGATGGGKSTVEPADEINLHFTGDSYAITEAHDLLSSLLDNHLYQGNALHIDSRKILWPRAMDMEDRALRRVIVGNKTARHESGFIITAASEITSILSLAKDERNLRNRLGKIIVAYTRSGQPVTAQQLKADGAMALLLEKARLPNLVQTKEGNAAFVHGGAFANVSIGTNSLTATRSALGLAGPSGFVITETGFGSELGLEKFMDIVARHGKLHPRVAVVVATRKTIQLHGLENLFKHVENVRHFGPAPVVAINRFPEDKLAELKWVEQVCEQRGIPAAVVECFARGGSGAAALADAVLQAIGKKTKILPRPRPIYALSDSLKVKIEKVATSVYGARSVHYSRGAEQEIRRIGLHAHRLPVCIAKTQLSLSDDKKRAGRPSHFVARVTGVQLQAGAGIVLVKMGNVLLMPGLPLHPAAERMG